jgi:hypothetical protein
MGCKNGWLLRLAKKGVAYVRIENAESTIHI